MNRYIGYLIRKIRLKQNLSQEGLCKGICVVSYLSKIEKGTAQPAEEIIKQLFERLGVAYITDTEEIKRLRKVLVYYFDAFFHQEDTKQYEQASFEERMRWLGVAQQQIPSSKVLVQQGYVCFKVGKYMDSVRYLEQAYQMAAEEGNPTSLLESSYMLAACYTNHDQENMMRYYRRTIGLWLS